MKTTEPIRSKAHALALLNYFRKLGEKRNYLLICLCLHTALRISDVLRITTDDVYDFQNHKVRDSISIVEKKTGKTKTIALHKTVKKALSLYFPSVKPGTALICNNRTGKAISRVQAYRIIKAAAAGVNLPYNVSCHSLRKTFGYHAWKTGTSPAVIMDIFNHSSLVITKRYLGINQDDKNVVYLGMSFAA